MSGLITAFLLGMASLSAFGQVSILGGHNGANTQETILTPASVGSGNFEKLLAIGLSGGAPGNFQLSAQPLYVPGVQIAGVTHNVVIAATTGDDVFAVDADNGAQLWHITLLDAAHGAGPDAVNDPGILTNCAPNTDAIRIGITGTPVIDPSTGTIYLVGRTWESNYAVQRIHALDITSGAEKFGAPVAIQATVPGTGWESILGQVSFDPEVEVQRSGLLLLNGVVYVAFASFCEGDFGGWHGWVMGYNAATMSQTGAWATTPNATGGGIWMSGVALAAEVPDPVNHPFGRMFVATGNGTFDASPPYTASQDFGDSLVNLDLTNGVITPQDSFTVDNQASLDATDGDLGSGGMLILPDSAGSMLHPHLLVEGSKTGFISLVDRDNMGGYSATTDNSVQELNGALSSGVYGEPGYWNGNLYFWASTDHLKAFSLANAAISLSPTSVSAATSNYPGATPSISANGATNGIVWALITESSGTESLQAYDATNLATLLYTSDTDPTRDNPGIRAKFSVASVANGKVFFGGAIVYVFGSMFTVTAQSSLLQAAPGSSPQVTVEVASPFGSSFSGAVTLSVLDLPAGVTANFSSPVVTLGASPASGSSVTTLQIPSTMAAGNYPFQVVGSNGGLLSSLALDLMVPATVPGVVGLTQAAATTAIQNAGLIVGTVSTASSNTVPAGEVISQSPVAGTSAAAGSAVNLVVSIGAQVPVPNVGGDTQSAATTAINAAGLVLGTVTPQSSSTVASGSVISESPAAGTLVNAGSAVNLVVSTGPGLAPGVVSVTPNPATGFSNTFQLTYSDTNGNSSLKFVDVIFGVATGLSNTCYVTYAPAKNLLYLYNDAGTGLTSIAIPGSGTLSNSQCTVTGSGTSVVKSGNNLTLNLQVAASSTYTAKLTVFMNAVDISTVTTGWLNEGTWMPVANQPPEVVSVSPTPPVTGVTNTFALEYSDPNGVLDLKFLDVIFGAGTGLSNTCYVTYAPAKNLLYLYNNAGTGLTSIAIPGSGTLSNSQCTVTGSGTSVLRSGNNLTLNLQVTASSSYAAKQTIYMDAVDNSMATTGWVNEGTWTPGVSQMPSVVSVTPNPATGFSNAFQLTYSDTSGYASLKFADVIFGVGTGLANTCYVTYAPAGNLLYLYNDAGTGLTSIAIPGSGKLSNSQCTVTGSGTSVVKSGNNLTLNLQVTASSTYTSKLTIFMNAVDIGTVSTGWVNEGTWTP